jgi:hypothetical protein
MAVLLNSLIRKLTSLDKQKFLIVNSDITVSGAETDTHHHSTPLK